MKIDINYKPEKQIDISAFSFAGEGDYITIKKIPREIKQKLGYYQSSSSTTEFSQWMIDHLKSGEIKPEDFVKKEEFTKQYNEMVKSMDDTTIDKASHSVYLIEKLTIDYGLDTDKHTMVDIGDKPIYLNHDSLALMVSGIPSMEKFVSFLVKEINDYNKEESICLGEPIN